MLESLFLPVLTSTESYPFRRHVFGFSIQGGLGANVFFVFFCLVKTSLSNRKGKKGGVCVWGGEIAGRKKIKFCNNQVSRKKPLVSYFSAFLGMKVEDRVATPTGP